MEVMCDNFAVNCFQVPIDWRELNKWTRLNYYQIPTESLIGSFFHCPQAPDDLREHFGLNTNKVTVLFFTM